MALYKTMQNITNQLVNLIELLTDEAYTQPIDTLNGSSIGQHVRHVTELFEQLYVGYHSGEVNYDNRKRDMATETVRQVAINKINSIFSEMEKEEKPLRLVCNYSQTNETIIVTTNFTRELIYNIEHAVHHLALIRIGVSCLSPISLPEDFGVATSTIRYKKECAQ